MSDTPLVTPSPEQPTSSHEAFVNLFGKQAKVEPKRGFGKKKRIALIIGGVVLVLALLLGGIGLFGYIKVRALKGRADEAAFAGRELYDAVKTQNLVAANEKMQTLRVKVDAFDREYKGMAWVGIVPVAGAYYRDGEHGIKAGYAGMHAAETLIKAVEPYADVLGFKGQGTFTGGSAEERIVKIIDTLDKVLPSLDSVMSDLDIVNKELAYIDERKYPEEFRGMKVREQLSNAKKGANEAVTIMGQAKPIIQVLPDLAGGKTRKKYLVLFQNAGELRPTGGFLTGYAVLNVDKGKVEPEGSGDIYDLDKKFRNKPPIPAILKQFLTSETSWNLRDMNLSPDYKVSMDTFFNNYKKNSREAVNIDGIIGVDTHFLENLVKVLGPVEVPGYGTFSAETDKRCDCPQIIYALSEIVDRPTPYLRENRKGILGPMMKSILTKAYSAPKEVWPNLFGTGWKNLEGKHIQLYFFDAASQQAAEAINAAGRIVTTPENSDYLAVIDTNLAGAKSNFFVNTTVEHEVELPKDGKLQHKVTIVYKNPFKASNCNLEAGQLCLNGKLNDWVRLYLPKGATLVETRGFDEGSAKTSEDLEHAVVEGVFQLQPQSQAKVEVTYTVPYTDGKNYNILIQKQGGTEDIAHKLIVNGEEHDLVLDKDKKVSFPF